MGKVPFEKTCQIKDAYGFIINLNTKIQNVLARLNRKKKTWAKNSWEKVNELNKTEKKNK